MILMMILVPCQHIFGHDSGLLNQPLNDLPQHEPASFHHFYNEFKHTCRSVNLLMPRHNVSDDLSLYLRNWSLDNGLIQKYWGHDTLSGLSPLFCQNSAELAATLTQPVDNLPCGLSWYSRNGICAVLDKYESVVILGDSLARMILQGFLLLMKGDYRFGALDPNHGRNGTKIFSECQCDGMFSEHVDCRNDFIHTGFLSTNMYESGYCPTFISNYRYVFNRGQFTCSTTNRPILLFVQGGVHCIHNITICVEDVFSPIIQRANTILKNCNDSIRIIYAGSSSSSPSLVAEFEYQADPIVRQYHKDLNAWFRDHYPSARSVEFFELSKVAETSDGYHQIEEGNMIKAMSILNMMYFMSMENRHSEREESVVP